MGVPEPLFHRIRVPILVDERVVKPMVKGPAKGASLSRKGGEEKKNDLDQRVRFIGIVGKEAVIACRDRDFCREYERQHRSDHPPRWRCIPKVDGKGRE